MSKARRNHDRAISARRAIAMARPELREPSSPRTAPASPTARAVKARDPQVDAMVAAFLAAREGRAP